MTSPRIVVRYFGPGQGRMWERLVSILRFSAERHCHEWTLDLASTEPREPDLYSPRGVQGYVWNTHKLDLWCDVVQQATDGDRLLLLDADTVILRPLDPIWEQPFDLAYTVKPESCTLPHNGGVLFVRVSDVVREFMELWKAKNRLFLDNPLEFDVWRAFGGLNQAALGAVLRQKQHRVSIRKLPCLEWNCEDEHWSEFDPKVTRILHIKSHLQRAIFKMVKPEPEARALVKLWRELESQSMGNAPTPEAPIVQPDHTTHVAPDELSTPESQASAPILTRAQRRRLKREQEQTPAA